MLKCGYSGAQYMPGDLVVERVSLETLGYDSVAATEADARRALKLMGAYTKCPGCGRRLKLRKGLHNRMYLMLPQHNKVAKN